MIVALFLLQQELTLLHQLLDMFFFLATDGLDNRSGLAPEQGFDFVKEQQGVLFKLQCPGDQFLLGQDPCKIQRTGDLLDQQLDELAVFAEQLLAFCRLAGIEFIEVGVDGAVFSLFRGQDSEQFLDNGIGCRLLGLFIKSPAMFFKPDGQVKDRFKGCNTLGS